MDFDDTAEEAAFRAEAHAWLEAHAPAIRIAGGSNEIQRNIIGERVLGLPGEARVDRDVPFRLLVQGGR